MIKRVRFRNFKALRNVSLNLDRFTVIVGPNASGKTSILEGIYCLSQLVGEHPGQVLKDSLDPNSLYRSGADAPMELELATAETEMTVVARPQVGADVDPKSDDSRTRKWVFDVSDGSGSGEKAAERSTTYESDSLGLFSTGQNIGDKFKQRLGELRAAVLLRFDASHLAAPSYSDEAVPRVESDGKGLASALAHLKKCHTDEFEAIQAALSTVVPSVSDIRFERAKIVETESETISMGNEVIHRTIPRDFWGESILFDTANAESLPAHLASEGTMLVLGLLTVILSPDRPRVILLDDIDRALHPKAQETLIAELRKFLEEFPDVQIVATSHSPYLLDHLRPEEVRITNVNEDGTVSCAALSDHAEFDRWKEQMTPGEFWSMVGEDWVSQTPSEETAT